VGGGGAVGAASGACMWRCWCLRARGVASWRVARKVAKGRRDEGTKKQRDKGCTRVRASLAGGRTSAEHAEVAALRKGAAVGALVALVLEVLDGELRQRR
jgi:hypothetical protein